jgi:hypothetical protein
MHVSSLGFRTDLALLTASGSVVEDRGTHLVVRSPDNPSYFWGNFILLARPPVPGGEREVVDAFRAEFPRADHVSIGIDAPDLPDGSRAAFEAAGMKVDVATVLTASTLTAPREVEAEVRALDGDDDWEARARLSRRLYPQTSEEAFMTFARQKSAQERRLVDAGRGQRFGASSRASSSPPPGSSSPRTGWPASRASRPTPTTVARGWPPPWSTELVSTPSTTSSRVLAYARS